MCDVGGGSWGAKLAGGLVIPGVCRSLSGWLASLRPGGGAAAAAAVGRCLCLVCSSLALVAKTPPHPRGPQGPSGAITAGLVGQWASYFATAWSINMMPTMYVKTPRPRPLPAACCCHRRRPRPPPPPAAAAAEASCRPLLPLPPATRCRGGGRHRCCCCCCWLVQPLDLAAPFCAAVRHTALRPLTPRPCINPLCRAFRRLGIEEVQEERPEAAGAES